MSEQKQPKLTASITTKNIRQEKPFVRTEGELTEAQLEAIAAGGLRVN